MVPSPRVLAGSSATWARGSVRVGFVTVSTTRSPDMFGIQISTAYTGHTDFMFGNLTTQPYLTFGI